MSHFPLPSPSKNLSDRERAIRQRLKSDFRHYAEKCLRIRTKAAVVEPLRLNRVQLYLHEQIERQLAETGKVRAIVLKGRQQGCSTYVGGRYYWKATHSAGSVFILTHEQAATDTLFGMVERFHTNCPALVRPSSSAANAKELYFDALDAGYEVGTAGTKAVGRSKTIQLLHGSEVAFWPNAATHFAGVVQAVPDLPGTEIVLESTANGIGGEFHERWQQAEAGIGDYIAIFVPWFWEDKYRRPASPDFVLDAEEEDYATIYALDRDQMAWRRAKLAELKDELLFKQEYPATAAEAFQLSGVDSYIPAALILQARKAVCEGIGPLVIGVDPARFGNDRFALAWRRGRKVEKVESRGKIDVVAGANWCREVIDRDKPKRMFIDIGAMGAGVYDMLASWGYADRHDKGDIARAVNFGGEPMQPILYDDAGQPVPGPKNRRAEMWMRSKTWLQEVGGANVPDLDSIHADACSTGYSYDANQRLVLESKEKMRARGIRSPDEWDAIALTFAEPVGIDPAPRNADTEHRHSRVPGGWMG